MAKFYAVRKGKKPGIYTTWAECRLQVFGFPGAEYKGFDKQEDAEAFMNSEVLNNNTIDLNTIGPYAFVDGSFNQKAGLYGYGGFLKDGDNKYIIQGSGSEPNMLSMRNIAGEILGAQKAVEKAIELGLTKISIFYDYMGIEMWAKGLWDRNNECTQAYHAFMQSKKDLIELHFIKVKGHTGIDGNEEADQLAKQAVGIS
jgi:ribonuclease HI